MSTHITELPESVFRLSQTVASQFKRAAATHGITIYFAVDNIGKPLASAILFNDHMESASACGATRDEFRGQFDAAINLLNG